MKKILVLSFIFLVASYSYSFCQSRDIIHLKNDSIIKGEIIEHIPDKAVKIKLIDSRILTFEMDEIKEISKEELPYTNTTEVTNRKPKASEHKGYGFAGIVKVGVLGSYDSRSLDAGHISIGGGYIFDRNFTLFLCLGSNGYNSNRGIFTLFPAYLSCRYIMTPGKIAPFIQFGGGGAYIYSNVSYNSESIKFPYAIYGQTDVGVSFLLSRGFMLSLSVGYNIYIPDEKNLIHIFPISLGFHF